MPTKYRAYFRVTNHAIGEDFGPPSPKGEYWSPPDFDAWEFISSEVKTVVVAYGGVKGERVFATWRRMEEIKGEG